MLVALITYGGVFREKRNYEIVYTSDEVLDECNDFEWIEHYD